MAGGGSGEAIMSAFFLAIFGPLTGRVYVDSDVDEL